MNTLNYFVQSYKQSRKETSTEWDQLYLQRAIDCLKKLRALKMMDNATKWVPLDIQTTGQGEKWAHLPSDYRSYLWVGCCQNGIFVNFDLNENLCMIPPWEQCACDSDVQVSILQQCCNGNAGGGSGGGINNGGWWTGLWGGGQPWSYSYSVGSYAIGPGDTDRRGTFRIDEANHIIKFDRCVEKATICYNGDFLTDMGNCFVPPGIEDNMIIQHWMDWQEKEMSPDLNKNRQANAAWGKCYTAIRDYNSQRNSLSRSMWLDLERKFTFLGVKA